MTCHVRRLLLTANFAALLEIECDLRGPPQPPRVFDFQLLLAQRCSNFPHVTFFTLFIRTLSHISLSFCLLWFSFFPPLCSAPPTSLSPLNFSTAVARGIQSRRSHCIYSLCCVCVWLCVFCRGWGGVGCHVAFLPCRLLWRAPW